MKTEKEISFQCLRPCLLGLLLASSLVLSSCTATHQKQNVQVSERSQLRISTQLYFYPNRGQSAVQQDRDRYECYLWAVRQTGFDPSSPHLAPHQRVVVMSQPREGHDTAVGAVSGALIGAVVGAPHNTGEGAAIGALAGAMVGAASDASREEQTDALQERYDREAARKDAASERKAADYRRAMKACLEGRGYTVR